MIVGYHTQITQNWIDNELHHKLDLLPQWLRDKITAKRKHLDLQLSVTGNLLLLKLIDHFGLDLKLDDLQYSQYRRPNFPGNFDFNISHSGNRVICCATTQGKIGVDIELMRSISINYEDYFTATEQQNIRAAQNPDTEFFKYWARKEAILKAAGTGVYTPLLDIDVSADQVIYQYHIYRLLPLNIDTDYAGYAACNVKQELILKKVEV